MKAPAPETKIAKKEKIKLPAMDAPIITFRLSYLSDSEPIGH